MNFTLERISGPEFEPITLTEAKLHLRAYSGTDRDAEITALIKSAREWVERLTGRVLIEQRWRLNYGESLSADPVQESVSGSVTPTTDAIYLHRSPVIAITSIASVDSLGEETELEEDTYELREEGSKWPKVVRLSGSAWTNGSFRITFRAGYADTDSSPQQDATVVPETFKRAMLLYIGALYDGDEKMMPLNLKVAEMLLEPETSNLQFA